MLCIFYNNKIFQAKTLPVVGYEPFPTRFRVLMLRNIIQGGLVNALIEFVWWYFPHTHTIFKEGCPSTFFTNGCHKTCPHVQTGGGMSWNQQHSTGRPIVWSLLKQRSEVSLLHPHTCDSLPPGRLMDTPNKTKTSKAPFLIKRDIYQEGNNLYLTW